MRRLLGLLVTAFLITGCAGQSVLVGGTSLTTPIQNPVGRQQLAQIEAAYGVVLTAAVTYRRLPLCKAGQPTSFTNVCSQRAIVLLLQSYDRKAQAALRVARNFVRNNPTLNAFTVLDAAQTAVNDFRNAASNNGVM